MRIGFVVPARGFAGGIERHAHDLARALADRGHEMTLIHYSDGGRDPDRYAEPFARMVPWEQAHRVRDALDVVYAHRADTVADLRPFEGLPVAVATHDHDLTCVRSHRYLPLSHEPCHRPPGIDCVTHGCVLVRDRGPGPLPVRLRNPFSLRGRLLQLSARAPLVANSRYVAQHLVQAGVSRDGTHIVHPVPPEDARPPVPLPSERRLLVAGQLLRGKGIDLAIDAMAHIPSDVHLEVVGDGPSRPALEKQAQSVAPGRVHFRGYVPPSDMGAAYDGATAVLVPSRWPEPFGMVGIEAMRRARPVVGAGHGGIVEWLVPGVAGELFTPGSAVDLGRAIQRVLADPDRGTRAAEHVRTHFAHADMVDHIEQLLDQVRQTDK